ncbi:Lactonase, 7-bladed beta-propeller [Rubripirellula tenax]|uniref:Lactonase, 7-bladed beta-propeller n=1 Tax=Rubripirellula tenax TaxID=2528015 RepID=A0A5C6FKM0_9BACT|nr:c-type cytochrome [Rubripirellula tenax]TWU60557.1 Lactonase, 7-bladed beta-propeller [Rubripirellula tenax]
MRFRHLAKTGRILALVAFALGLSNHLANGLIAAETATSKLVGVDRSPIDLVISADQQWIVTANETSGSLSLIRVTDRQVIDEIIVGDHPANVLGTPDGKHVVVSTAWDGNLHQLRIDADRGKLVLVNSVHVGMQPCGIAILPDSTKAYVGCVANAEIVEVDLNAAKVIRRFSTGNWPRYLTLTPDGKRLAVGLAGNSEIAVIEIDSGKTLYTEPLSGGINLGQMITSSDGTYAYFPWMVYRTNPITVRNIKLGWVLASRMGRVRLDGAAYREAVSLDVPELAVADTHDVAITSDGKRLIASSSGTHELLSYRLPDMPFIAEGGPGDLIDPQLQYNADRFERIEVGGRPMGIAIADDDQTIFVANYLRNSVQVVSRDEAAVIAEIDLGGAKTLTLARKGMEIFHDAVRSLDQWYSCQTCHAGGGTNAKIMDTFNDATEMTFKTVLPLQNVTRTGPWTWHGWQTDLDDAMHRSIVSSMQGVRPAPADKSALIAYLETLDFPPNPFRGDGGSLSEAAARGKVVFESNKAACIDCHHGSTFTDGEIHDVGTGSKSDHYQGYNTPSLNGSYTKVRWLHHGRAKSLLEVVTDYHSPDKVNGSEPLTDGEAADLVAYLKSL